MKKIKKLLTIGLAFLFMLGMSSCTHNQFLDKEMKKIPVECNDYALEWGVSETSNGTILECEIFGSRGAHFEEEVYNKNGLRIIQKGVVAGSNRNDACDFFIDYQGQNWQIDREYMEQFATYVTIDSIWLKWNNGKPNDNNIVYLYVTDDNRIFLIIASTQDRVSTYFCHPTVLWYFDLATGKILYCDYLKNDDGEPLIKYHNYCVIVEKE